MDRYNACLQSSCTLDIAHIQQSLAINFSEHEIFTLYDMLLIPGIHRLKVNNIVVGRAVLKLFLDSLNVYQYIHWLSASPVPSGVVAMYHEMLAAGCIQTPSSDAYSLYFHNEPYMHMLVIECSQALMDSSWYTAFEQACIDSSLYACVPVIQVHYA